jgi:hypothetical protein
MARSTDLHKHTLHLRKGDWDFIESICRPNGIPTSVTIRVLVSNFVDEQKAKENPIDVSGLNISI